MFLVLMSVFSLVFGTDPTYGFNLLVGLFVWDFFADSTKTGLVSLHAKAYLISKIKFPAWVLVIVSISNALVTLAVFSSTFVFYLAITGRWPGLFSIALFALYLAMATLMVCGFCLASSVVFLRFRDLNQVWDLATQAGFFVAPVIYPLSIVPDRYHVLLYCWPPTSVIQFSRAVLVEGVVPDVRAQLLLAAGTLVTLAVGILIYRRFGPRLAEYI
jgi:lipopolysaccharide transport system permease protein